MSEVATIGPDITKTDFPSHGANGRGRTVSAAASREQAAGLLRGETDVQNRARMASSVPEGARAMFKVLVDQLCRFDAQIADLDREIERRAKADEAARTLMPRRCGGH